MGSVKREIVQRRLLVIPVLLGDAPAKLPPFLALFSWVDFRKRVPDPMGQLIWGITGKRPAGTEKWRNSILQLTAEDAAWKCCLILVERSMVSYNESKRRREPDGEPGARRAAYARSG